MKEQNRNPNKFVIIANNKIETRNDRFDRGRKKSKRFYHRRRGCGNFSWLYRRRNISPVVSNRAGGHTRDEVMQNTPVDPFPPFSSPPDSFSYFRGGTPAGGFRRKPVYVPRREFEDISARKARQFHRASIRERRNIHGGCVYVYINFVVENPPVFGTKF